MNEITISKDVLAQEIDGETVLLDLASESFFGLDSISTRVWQLLNEGAGREQVVDTLLVEYEVERQVLEKDVADLLDRLVEAGLISLG
jgi:hypothetical protein